jgi:MFS family permease
MVIGSVFVLGGTIIAAFSGNDFNLLRISRYVGGLGVGCAATSATTAISLWFGDKNRGLAMAIWATWVPVAMIINYVILRPFALAGMTTPDDAIGKIIGMHPEFIGEHGPDMAQVLPLAIPEIGAPNIHLLYIVGTIIAAIAFVLMLIVYKNPPQDLSAVSIQKTPFKEAFKFITKRRVIALLFSMFFFTFVSNCFTTYNVAFFTTPVSAGGQGMEQGTAGLVAVIASACGILAPIFGAINDKVHPNRKYIILVLAGISYTLACVFGFKAWGLPLLVVYIIFSVLAMAMVNASIRPGMPLLVKDGGISAVSLGLAAITFLEFFGQIFTTFFGMAIDAFSVIENGVTLHSGFAEAGWVIAFPAAIVLIVCALLTKPGKKDLLPEGKPQGGAPEGAPEH